MTKRDIHLLVSAIDTNGDGAISVAELKAHLESVGYVLQLGLSNLEFLARRLSCDKISIELVVRCIIEAPDRIGRGAAMRLLGILAQKVPKKSLRHILGVLSHIKDSPSALRDESIDHKAMTDAMAMITPAWIANGRSWGSGAAN